MFRCFHKNITGQQAEKLLMEKGRDGSFLCRPSASNKNDYSLSVRREGDVTHIKIQNHGNYYDLCGGEPFLTLHELIKYYQDNGGLPEKNGEFIELLYPINCKDPTSERWFHGHMSGKDAEKLLLEKGKNGSYLVRESVSQLGHYVISIRSDDHVKQVKMRNIDGKFDFGGEPSFTSIDKLIDFYSQNPMVEENASTILHLKQPFNSTTFTASDIADRVLELQKDSKLLPGKDGYWEELEQLQQQETRHRYTRKVGMAAENKNKNRFKNIVPFDHTRVILRDSENDYINASYIRGENGDCGCEYIATQGCLPETICDFLRMIYQENSKIILMLTPEVEKDKIRCARYWPDLNSSMEVQHFIIRNLKETETQEFTLRVLELENSNEPSKKPCTLYQYQYVALPENSHPDNVGSVLGILHDISLKQKDCPDAGPLVVHCSNGIGRTASIIVIDMLVKLLQKEGLECEIDIQKTVQHVRTQRFDQMVQLEAQYKFIYLAIAHHVEMERFLPQAETKRSIPSPTKSKKSEPLPQRSLRRVPSRDHDNVNTSKPTPPTIAHRPPPKPPVIAINGTLPPPIPQRKPGNDQSMCNIFSKPQHVEEPPLPTTPPPIPDRKKGN